MLRARRPISPLAGKMPDRAEGGNDPDSVFAVSPPSVNYGDQGRATGLARPSDPAARGRLGAVVRLCSIELVGPAQLWGGAFPKAR